MAKINIIITLISFEIPFFHEYSLIFSEKNVLIALSGKHKTAFPFMLCIPVNAQVYAAK